MSRSVLRSLAILFVAFLLAFTVGERLLRYDPTSVDPLDEFIDGAALLAVDRLASVPEAERAAELERMAEQFDMPVSLTDRRLPHPDPSAPLGLIATAGDAPNTFVVLVELPDSPLRLQFGPVRAAPEVTLFSRGLSIAGVCLILGVAAAWLVWPTVLRVREVEQVVRRFGEGDRAARVIVRGSDALGGLEAGVNGMAEEVMGLLDAQRHLLEAVSHELRTPAARMRFRLELLRGAEEKHIEGLRRDIDQIDTLISEILDFIRGANASISCEWVSLPPTEIAQGVSWEGSARVWADPLQLDRVVDNLVGNAQQHGDGDVIVRLGESTDGVWLTVCDGGPGIPEADRVRVLEPFAQVDPSRGADGGVGLGLAIVRRIVERHGGAVTIGVAPEGGAAVRTTWPSSPG